MDVTTKKWSKWMYPQKSGPNGCTHKKVVQMDVTAKKLSKWM